MSRSGDTVKVFESALGDKTYPVRDLGAIILHGYPQITTQALHFCAANDVAVHWVSFGGRYVGALAAGPGPVQRRIRQYNALTDSAIRLELARKLAMAKVEAGLRYLLRVGRNGKHASLIFSERIEKMRTSLKGMAQADNPDTLRGHEGLAGRAYFGALPNLLREEIPPEMRFTGRNRRPPLDRFNALLGFGYALLYQTVLQAVLTVGLDPALGFYHQPRSSAHPLVLDLMELFRLSVWDMTVIGSINRLQWDPDADFQITGRRVWLSYNGRKKAISLYEKRLQDAWRHPVVKYSLSYERLVELEVRLLEKEWGPQPGLFARMRLR